jgi:hypothetical protein
VHFGDRSSTGELLTYFCYIFTIISVVMFTIWFSLQEKYKEEVVKKYCEGFKYEGGPLTVGSSMTAEAEKHIDGEIDTLFCLTLGMRDTIPLTTVDYFLKACSVRWGAGLQGDNATEAKFTIHVFWSYASSILDTLKL